MKPLKCIIVEDEPEFIEILQFLLSKIEGIEIVGAYGDTVNAAIQIEKRKPDFIFLDINISGLEGPEFVEVLDHKPKIIVISAHTEGFMKHYPEVPYVDFVQKPPTLQRLKEAIAKCQF
ncbi:LytTR family DNA-binding domain-containing protein [Marinoscillum sp. MHG1-6]|uniref:LytR/AlgR family response regulator transcription factor n=1 Tax=Marinoscillum sp. MHG1-6 TaxID=2959627 RepID=UPI002157A105|nr:response regulator [Marinoscillum sp. MHG1-6]